MLKKVYNINSLSINFFHSSSIYYADMHININHLMNTGNNLGLNENQRFSQLQMVRYDPNITREQLNDLNISSYAESFPWFLDESGQIIDYNKPIRLFNGIKLISNYFL